MSAVANGAAQEPVAKECDPEAVPMCNICQKVFVGPMEAGIRANEEALVEANSTHIVCIGIFCFCGRLNGTYNFRKVSDEDLVDLLGDMGPL